MKMEFFQNCIHTVFSHPYSDGPSCSSENFTHLRSDITLRQQMEFKISKRDKKLIGYLFCNLDLTAHKNCLKRYHQKILIIKLTNVAQLQSSSPGRYS